jgi:hypothetical protein
MATYSIDYIYRILDKFSAPLNRIGVTQKNFQRHVDKSKQKIMGMKNALTSNIATMVGWGAAIYGVSKAIKTGISLASDLTEVQNVVDTTFKENAATINEWSQKALNGFGLSELQAKKFTGTIGAMLKSTGITGDNLVGMSTKLTGLAGDFASFYNLPHEQAFNKIRAGISGETEPLKQIGINMSVANLEAFALTQGITKQYKKMTQAEQVALRYNYLIKASADAQGDFAKTLETSFANQTRVLKTRFQEKLANSMKKLLPVLTKVFKGMNKFVASIDTDKIGRFIMAMVKVIGVLVKVVKFLKPLLPIMIGVIAAWKAYQIATMIAAAGQMILNAAMAANPIGIVITAIGVLIGLIYLLHKHWDKVVIVMAKVGKKAVEIWDASKGFLMFVLPGFVQLIELIRVIVENFGYVKKSFTDKGFLAGIMAIGKAIVSAFLAPIQSLLEAAGKIPKIGAWAKKAADGIKNFRENLFPKDAADKMDKTRDAQKNNVLLYKDAQSKAREQASFTESYMRTPDTAKTKDWRATVNANMNLKIFNETDSKVSPMNSTGDLGYNEVGR